MPPGQTASVSSLGRPGTEVLIETKLYAPPAREEWVERDELIRHLAGSPAKLVLVDAPAGFGKSTLVAQWRSSPAEGRPFAWVSLDRGDDDPGRLWWHLVCSLQRACPQFGGGDILRALRAQLPDFTGVVLPMLVNELATLPAPVVLVLDDYHAIRERGCHEQVASLLVHLPSSAQVVIISRADPPLPVARMRAAGELTEIRARELRFGPAETDALVRAVSGVAFSPPDLADLVERTEGWPAGVYLAALCLRGHLSPGAFVRQFTGDNRFIVDFLAEEVLSQQPNEVRQFLARTSILARFCAPLCNAVAGSADADKITGVLERENLFVVPLDETRQWFRYHHLFAEALRSQLARTEPDLVPSLHQRASAWHQRSGSADEAIRHARAAGDAAGMIDLIARHWYGYVDSGRAATVRGWLRSLGDDATAASPLAAHCAMWLGALTGDQGSVRRWLPVLETAEDAGPLPDGIRSFASSAALLQGLFGFDGIGPMREAGARAVELETDPASPWYGAARAGYGLALYFSGESGLAAEQLEKARLSNAAIAMVRMLAFAGLAWLAIDAGRISQGEALAGMARDIATDPALSLGNVPQSTLAAIATGAVHAARGRLDQARSELEAALRLRRQWAGISPWPTVELLLRFTPVLAGLGEPAEAAALLDEARQLLGSLPDGADAQLERLGRLERRLAGRSRAVSPDDPLTERELAVLRLLTGTLPLRQIGNELYLSPNTVKTHTQAIYRKLGVSARTDAVARGRELGLI